MIFEDFKFAYKTILPKMTCPQLRTKTRTSISRKICCVKLGFQILYAVEQFSSLFSKDKLKQGAHIHQTHDPPSPRMSWESCHTVPSQQLPHVLFGTAWLLKDSPLQERVLYEGFFPVTDQRQNHCAWLALSA